MAETMCLMFTQSDSFGDVLRVLSLAAAAVDVYKRTVLYVGGRWIELARSDKFLADRERDYQRSYKVSVVELFRHFQNAGGQLWVSALSAQQLDLAVYRHGQFS